MRVVFMCERYGKDKIKSLVVIPSISYFSYKVDFC